jgi:membrane-associated protease RseP (regulator of RpoE activity)
MAEALVGLADVTAVFTSRKEILLKGVPITRLSGMNEIIESRLGNFGYKAEVISTEPSLVVRMKPPGMQAESKFPWSNLGLFVLTVISTVLAGAMQEGVGLLSKPGVLIQNPMMVLIAGVPFSVSLLAILVFHEFGHYVVARRHKVNVSLPYFIPAPTIIGTFGAVVKSRSAFMDRRQLLDVAAAGPLSGLVVAAVVLVIGIGRSTTVLMPESTAPAMFFGESLLFQTITNLVKGPIPEGHTLMLNSIAFAGWVGLLVTMLNLLPIGQLDGGHIIYALFGKAQKTMAYVVMLGIIVLSFWWTGWALWLILAILIRPAHPPTLMDEVPIGASRKIIGYLCIAAFVLCFMPVPVSYN